jgi:hypothetical protein
MIPSYTQSADTLAGILRDGEFWSAALSTGEVVRSSQQKLREEQGKPLLPTSRSQVLTTEELPKRPKKERDQMKSAQLEREAKEIQLAQEENQHVGRSGRVILSRLQMMKPPEYIPGFLKVFPNYKVCSLSNSGSSDSWQHDNRHDGFGCKVISESRLLPGRQVFFA